VSAHFVALDGDDGLVPAPHDRTRIDAEEPEDRDDLRVSAIVAFFGTGVVPAPSTAVMVTLLANAGDPWRALSAARPHSRLGSPERSRIRADRENAAVLAAAESMPSEKTDVQAAQQDRCGVADAEVGRLLVESNAVSRFSRPRPRRAAPAEPGPLAPAREAYRGRVDRPRFLRASPASARVPPCGVPHHACPLLIPFGSPSASETQHAMMRDLVRDLNAQPADVVLFRVLLANLPPTAAGFHVVTASARRMRRTRGRLAAG